MSGKAEKKPRYIIIGILRENGVLTLCEKAAQAVRGGRVFSGGKRQRQIVERLLPPGSEWIEIGGDIEKTVRIYDEHLKSGAEKIVIFASGDPLFYGIGGTLKRLRPEGIFEVFPAPSSVQALCRKAVIPYENLTAASVHGRDWHEFDRALIAGANLIGLLTDAQKSPRSAARRMIEYGFENYRCAVGENIGETGEQIRFFPAREMSRENFSQPSVVILEKIREKPVALNSEKFETLAGRPHMITKLPARICALGKLNLDHAKNFWDIGFCTGSVSVNARRSCPNLRVTAFEKNISCRKLIEKNAKKFSAPGIKVVMKDFFELNHEKLPAPDRVFIGGHGGRLKEMMAILGKIVQPGAVIAMNSVTEKSGRTFRENAEKTGFEIGEPIRILRDDGKFIEVLRAVKK